MDFLQHLSKRIKEEPQVVYATASIFALAFFYSSPRVQAWIRWCLLATSVILCSTWGIIISVWYRVETNYHATKAFARVCEWTAGIKFHVEGYEHLESGPSVVIYNHQTSLDIVFIGRAMPRRSVVLAKKELRWAPVFGQYLIFSRTVFLDRTNNKDAIAALRAAGQDLLAKQASLIVFPEGTRSLTPDCTLRPFKKGAFHVAIEAGIPIIPVVFQNQWSIYRPFSGVFKSGTCRIRVLPPISTKGLSVSDAATLAVTSRELMLEALKEISGSE